MLKSMMFTAAIVAVLLCVSNSSEGQVMAYPAPVGVTAYSVPVAPAYAVPVTTAYRPVYRPWFSGYSRWWRRNAFYAPVAAAPVTVANYAPVTVANYAPVATVAASPVVSCAPACNPCPTVQTVRYVPQTCYRTSYVNRPVTTCRAFTSCDPCTGCPVTVMRPVTTYVREARQVAYTAYRPVVVNSPCVTACSPCAVPTCAVAGCPTGCTTPACSTGSANSGIGAPTVQPSISPAEPQTSLRPEHSDTHSVKKPESKVEPMRNLEQRRKPAPELKLYESNDKTANWTSARRTAARVDAPIRLAADSNARIDDGGWQAASE